jgi:hypothetical protein
LVVSVTWSREHGVFWIDVPVARRISVVPVSAIPAVEGRIESRLEPYEIDWSKPTNSFEGEVAVMVLEHTNGMRWDLSA